ncbi:hypothetical protein HAL07_09380 [Helicobacter ailurogastricus]|uniref:Uncharacterized protein n=1 Tax=Helicobacter ailurogastricus TaxID=1578720 RepID=A0A0K2Y656_9HELI|nr:hypothetical protein HAL07_09380 [Helicobacter ailurogastricus]
MESLIESQGQISLCLDLQNSQNFKVLPFVALVCNPSERMIDVAESKEYQLFMQSGL